MSKGENIQYVAHAHPFTIYPILFKTLIFGILIPAGFYYLLPPFLYLWIGWGAVGIMIFSYRIVQWYMDAWIITNYGVIDSQWKSFFNKGTTRIEYDYVEGVSKEIKGFWGTILGYGDIKIEHMSGSVITLKNIANPRKVESKVVNHHQQYQEKQKFTDHSNLKDLLTKLIRTQ